MVSAAALSRPRVLIVGYRKFGQLMNAVADEFRERADIRVIEHLMGGDEPSGTVLGQEGADVVISAGANAAWLAATLSVPVVSLEITDADVVEAIARASEISRRILLLTYGGARSILEPLRKLSGLEVEQKNYMTVDEAREEFLLARRSGFEVVVGSSLVCELAEREGVPAIMLYTRASCRALLERAIARALEGTRAPREANAPRRVSAPGRNLVFASPEMQRIDALIKRSGTRTPCSAPRSRGRPDHRHAVHRVARSRRTPRQSRRHSPAEPHPVTSSPPSPTCSRVRRTVLASGAPSQQPKHWFAPPPRAIPRSR